MGEIRGVALVYLRVMHQALNEARPQVQWHFERDEDTGRKKQPDEYSYEENGPLWEGHIEGELRFAAFRHIRDGGWFFQDDWTGTCYNTSSLKEFRQLAQLIVDYEDPWIYAEDGWFSQSGRFYASSTPRDCDSGYHTFLRDFHTGHVYELPVWSDGIRKQALKILNSEAPNYGHCRLGGSHAAWLHYAIELRSKKAPLVLLQSGVACQGT